MSDGPMTHGNCSELEEELEDGLEEECACDTAPESSDDGPFESFTTTEKIAVGAALGSIGTLAVIGLVSFFRRKN